MTNPVFCIECQQWRTIVTAGPHTERYAAWLKSLRPTRRGRIGECFECATAKKERLERAGNAIWKKRPSPGTPDGLTFGKVQPQHGLVERQRRKKGSTDS